MMGRAQKEKQREKQVKPASEATPNEADLPPIVPPRKHPLLLAIVALLFAGWIAFLVWMAVYG
jgi:hypothetical protein